ncbi:MAG: hypothetical protein P0Y64_16580 [Candidatus Sphingomonas colombiensis]|nr:hypothetical protein [Sphingomonas sp.]WEK42935.1 MAG: hypothetical protein P0Y64_16580 [Sphingomonas sp.]
MRDILFKLRLLRLLLANAHEEWKREIWKCDLDAPYCCGGHECGCMATTTRELYSWHLRKDQSK